MPLLAKNALKPAEILMSLSICICFALVASLLLSDLAIDLRTFRMNTLLTRALNNMLARAAVMAYNKAETALDGRVLIAAFLEGLRRTTMYFAL